MTLQPTNTYKNIKASLERYIYTNLASNDSITVDWQGHRGTELENVDEWIAPRILRGGQFYRGHVTTSRKGTETEILLNINIFLRKGSTTNAHRLCELRDAVAQYFELNQGVNLKNYAVGGYPNVEIFIVREIMTDQEIPTGVVEGGITTDLYYQYNYTPRLCFISQF
jgi:hypothetical protein